MRQARPALTGGAAPARRRRAKSSLGSGGSGGGRCASQREAAGRAHPCPHGVALLRQHCLQRRQQLVTARPHPQQPQAPLQRGCDESP